VKEKMLVIPLTENDMPRLKEAEELADLIELRLDTFSSCDNLPSFTKPLIFTLRTKEQGGHFVGSHEERLSLLNSLAYLNPAYIDIEHNVPEFHIEGAKRICSYHHFTETPEDFDSIYEGMCNTMRADIYKIATTANSVTDLLRLLAFVKRSENVAGMCMGDFGHTSRILGPVAGSRLTYACLPGSQGTVPGQIDAETLINTYNFRTMNKETKIYALLGSPVEQSASHITHNAVLKDHNAVFVKLNIRPDKLADFFRVKRQLPFHGFSVTIPHKTHVNHYIDEVDEPSREIGAINTLYLKEGKWHGTNTDEIGALEALQEVLSIQGKRVVILGSGGAARAIAYGVKKWGGKVTIAGRTPERALSLAEDLLCKTAPIDKLPPYDILINATSVGMVPDVHSMPIEPSQILEGTTVMDIVAKPPETRLLEAAADKGCTTIPGTKMFVYQAAHQFLLWFPDEITREQAVQTIESHID
jgi:3-dehydroquinate dehydratase / shikimate dehydrogenase